MDKKPCCAAEALRRIRRIDVDGVVVGIAMLDRVITDVREMSLIDKKRIAEELLKRVKIYNYVPRSAEEKYMKALMIEYEKSAENNGE
ncbi:MAG TPA: hypothetical protein VMW63_10020 [Methanoregulaceae archaeon]|nr:hypothetical protein [Methanoregulaceae archaeon]